MAASPFFAGPHERAALYPHPEPPRRIATLYLPITIDTLVKVQQAFEHEFPDAAVETEPGHPEIMHILDRPIDT